MQQQKVTRALPVMFVTFIMSGMKYRLFTFRADGLSPSNFPKSGKTRSQKLLDTTDLVKQFSLQTGSETSQGVRPIATTADKQKGISLFSDPQVTPRAQEISSIPHQLPVRTSWYKHTSLYLISPAKHFENQGIRIKVIEHVSAIYV